jgi:hypothetical protein
MNSLIKSEDRINLKILKVFEELKFGFDICGFNNDSLITKNDGDKVPIFKLAEK